MKWTFDHLLQRWSDIRNECKTREEFQTLWTAAVAEAGWTKQEFGDALDDWCWEQYNS